MAKAATSSKSVSKSKNVQLPDTFKTNDILLSNIDKDKVAELVTKININDSSLAISYGTDAMKDISSFSDNLLKNVKINDESEVSEKLKEVMLQIKKVDIDDYIASKNSVLMKIPLIGKYFNKTERYLMNFKTIAEQVQEISNQLDISLINLIKDIEVLEQLYNYNENYYYQVCTYIEAGEQFLENIKNEELTQLQKEVENNPNDAMKVQKLRDLNSKIDRFEKRLNDLKISKTIAVQTAPQIRIIQENNQLLAEKIQSGILSTIPVWKNQLVLSMALEDQKKASNLSSIVSKTTNDLLKQNADLLQTGSIEVAKQSQESIVDLNTLKYTNEKLIKTLEETLKISSDARQKRNEISKELYNIEQNLKEKLIEISEDKKKIEISNS